MMFEQKVGDHKVKFGGLPRLADLPVWQLVTVFALAWMNASWGNVAFRIIGAYKNSPSASAGLIFLASVIFLTYLWMIALSGLHFREDYKRVVAGIWLLVLIGYLPVLLYPQFQGAYYLRFERYYTSIFQVNFLLTPEFLSSLFVIYFWQMGLNLSNHWTGIFAVNRRMRVSTILMITLGFLATDLGYVVPVIEIYLLLFSGLLAIGSARISSIGFKRGGRWVPFNRSFFALFALSAAALISLVLGLTSAVSEMLALAINRLVTILGIVLSWFLVAAFGPGIVMIVDLFEGILVRLEPFAGTMEEQVVPILTGIQAIIHDAAEETQPFRFADQLKEILGVVLPLLGILFALSLGYIALKRTRAARLKGDVDKDWQQIMVGSLPDYIRAFLQGGARSGLEALAQLVPIARVYAAARIRRIYRQLLRETARLGKAREQAETPLEFLSEMQAVFPGCQEELLLITRAYLRVRYGEYPESRREVEVVEQAWKDVRRRGVVFPNVD